MVTAKRRCLGDVRSSVIKLSGDINFSVKAALGAVTFSARQIVTAPSLEAIADHPLHPQHSDRT